MLAAAQALHRLLARCVADEVIATDAARRKHPAGAQDHDRRGERGLVARSHCALGPDERQVRPANRTGDRLRMEPSIERILVLAPAFRTQHEARHAGVRAVVRQCLDQRVARPALRAVDERIAMAAISGVGEFGHAFVAGEEVWRHGDLRRVGGTARRDLESGTPGRCAVCDLAHERPRERRRALDETAGERFERGRVAARDDLDVTAEIAHVTVEPVRTGEPMHERTKPDPLHPAGHDDPTGDLGPGCRVHGAAGPAASRACAAAFTTAPAALRPCPSFPLARVGRTPRARATRAMPRSPLRRGT